MTVSPRPVHLHCAAFPSPPSSSLFSRIVLAYSAACAGRGGPLICTLNARLGGHVIGR